MSAPKKKATKKTATATKKTAPKKKAVVETKPATAKKSTAATATEEKKVAAKKAPVRRKRSPFTGKLKKELDLWLSSHEYWNHDDWCHLLHVLQEKSLGDLTLTQEGRDSIGLYLETNRRSISA